jgi:hypothetical protein
MRSPLAPLDKAGSQKQGDQFMQHFLFNLVLGKIFGDRDRGNIIIKKARRKL